MNSTQDLILGVLGTQWERTRAGGVNTYLESIKRSGYAGRKVMLCWDIHPETRKDLLRYGFELIDLLTPPEPFFIARMRVCWEYLRDHHKEFRFVHWLDVKDLILQNDPSKWLENNIGKYSIIASSEPVPICTESTNWLWANNILGESKASEIANSLVINGGTSSGKSEAITEVFHQTYLLCKDYTGPYPPCQISMNYVMHTMFKDDLCIPLWSEGYAVCGHPIWSPWRVPCWPHMRDPHPVLDIDACVIHAGTKTDSTNSMVLFNDLWGVNTRMQIEANADPLRGIECVKNPQGKAFSIFHGYDRNWLLKSMFEHKYREGMDFNFEEFKKWNENNSQIIIPKRGLRRAKYEVPAGSCELSYPRRIFKRHL